MEKFDYEILFSKETPNGPTWYMASNNKPLGTDLLVTLKQAGQQGWEVVGTADVFFTSRVEIILKKKLA